MQRFITIKNVTEGGNKNQKSLIRFHSANKIEKKKEDRNRFGLPDIYLA